MRALIYRENVASARAGYALIVEAQNFKFLSYGVISCILPWADLGI